MGIRVQTLGLLVLLLFAGCATGPVYKSSFHGTSLRWYGGTVEEAFSEAARDGKLVFLYWGATWCPPCNELKNQVFSHAEFAALMDPVVPVYLDGDTQAAQSWGEKLAIHGYPTMLVLTARAEEIMRISSFVDFEEFKEAFHSAVTAKQRFGDILKLALAGKAKPEHWRLLAYFDWSTARGIDLTSEETLETRRKIADAAPRSLRAERTLLAAAVLAAAAEAKPGSKAAATIRANGESFLERVFYNEISIRAAREMVIYRTTPLMKFLFPGPSPARERWEKAWLRAARQLRGDETLSIDTRLWTFKPEIDLHRLDTPKAPVPKTLADFVEQSVKAADDAASTLFQRTAVISGAAFLLREVGRADAAEKLLRKEIELSPSPYYYEASLARLEESRGNAKAALAWSARARESAEGRATRLQWIASDIDMTARLDADKRSARLKRLVRELYDHAIKLDGGFLGRNYRYLNSAKRDILSRVKDDPSLVEAALYFLPDCERLPEASRERCRSHLKSYETGTSDS